MMIILIFLTTWKIITKNERSDIHQEAVRGDFEYKQNLFSHFDEAVEGRIEYLFTV